MDATDLYDVIVAGGGLSGISAAIGSARLGARTLLIERYGFLGGLATAGLVNPFMSWQTSTGKPLVGGIFTELCERMDSMDGMLGGAFDPEIMKYVTQEMVLESGAELLQHSAVIDVHVDKNKISRLSVEEKSGICDLRSKIVIDATGDADVAAMAGVDYELGDPATGATQAMTLMFTLGDVDIRKSLVYAMENPAEMRFPKPTSDHEIDKMLESAVGIAGFYAKVEEARSKREFPLQQDMVFFISLPMPRQVIVNTTHIGNVDGTSSEDLTRAEVEGRRQAISLVKFFREYIPGFENTYLLQTAAQVGIRETRRITGEYIFSAQDVIAARKFPDAVLRSIMYMLISPTGVTKRIEGLGSAAGAGMDSISSMSDTNQFTALLPEGALHVGDAWTKTVPMPNMASGQIRADSQLLSVNTKVGDYTVAKIKQTLTGTFTQTVQVPARNGAPASTVNGGGNLSGDVTEYFSPAKGQLIKSTGTIKMHIGMAVPGVQAYGQPGSGSGNLTMKTTMILLPPAHK